MCPLTRLSVRVYVFKCFSDVQKLKIESCVFYLGDRSLKAGLTVLLVSTNAKIYPKVNENRAAAVVTLLIAYSCLFLDSSEIFIRWQLHAKT